jgi:hypothetical protein
MANMRLISRDAGVDRDNCLAAALMARRCPAPPANPLDPMRNGGTTRETARQLRASHVMHLRCFGVRPPVNPSKAAQDGSVRDACCEEAAEALTYS